jgi:hypothetical protein
MWKIPFIQLYKKCGGWEEKREIFNILPKYPSLLKSSGSEKRVPYGCH